MQTQARIRYGDWMADCSCSRSTRLELNQTEATCLAESCGQSLEVTWPTDPEGIEECCAHLPKEERHYHPIWTLEEFEAILADPNHTIGP